jgi:hypothetical protein
VQGSGCRVQSSSFRFQGSGFRVQGSVLRIQGLASRAQGSGSRVYRVGFREQGPESKMKGAELMEQGFALSWQQTPYPAPGQSLGFGGQGSGSRGHQIVRVRTVKIGTLVATAPGLPAFRVERFSGHQACIQG